MNSPTKVLSIDVGYHNMGFVFAEISNFRIREVKYCNLIDISESCDDPNCKLHHMNCISDYMAHLFKNYAKYFDEADTILVERQPPGGLIAVQELILFQYRDKTILVSPNAMHKHFSINNHSYDQRKVVTTIIAEEYLVKFDIFNDNERKHDISDAIALLLFHLSKLKIKYNKIENLKKWKSQHKKYIGEIEKFRYTPCTKNS